MRQPMRFMMTRGLTAGPRREVMRQIVAPPVPRHRHDLTAAWLTSALRSTGVIAPGTRVRRCAKHPIVNVSVTGQARGDGGGLYGLQVVCLPRDRRGGLGRQ